MMDMLRVDPALWWRRALMFWPCLLVFGCAGLPEAVCAQTEQLLQMQAGEVRVLAIPDVARVAVGDGHVVNAITTEEKEVIIFARNEGSSAVQIWSSQGLRHRYQVEVAPEGARQTQAELKSVLGRIPNAQVSVVGDKLLVEGSNLSDGDRKRVEALSRRYPQLVDFTSMIGWDRMVLLDVQVVEVPTSQLQELGVRWDTETTGGLGTGFAWEGASRGIEIRPAEAPLAMAFPAGIAAGYFGANALLSAKIRLMAQTGDAVVLAQPQLLARSGSTAEFLAGGEVPYSTVDANGNTNTSFKPYGVSLKITPQVEANGAIRSRLEVEVSSIDTALSIPTGPSLKTRRAATEFNVVSGQTLVLAGFISRELSSNVSKVPGLGDIPVLGELFKSERFQRQETELAIFVTPVIVDADNPHLDDRIRRSGAVLEAAFPTPPLVNTPVKPSGGLPGPVIPEDGRRWQPFEGAGSQWTSADSSSTTFKGIR
jgi:pilus assembly protein CpaC